MKKIKILVISICIIAIVYAITAFINFVGGISATFDPIKTYDCTGKINTLVKRLNYLTQHNKSLSYRITDTTGTKESGHDYYFQLHWITPRPDTIEYSIKLSTTNYHFAKNKTVIDLVEAINITHLTGGYSQTAKGIQPLIEIFDKNIISQLTNDNR